jgi:hypothetical protein
MVFTKETFAFTAANMPDYLTKTEQYRMLQEFKNYPHIDYYTAYSSDECWQGDGWSQLEIFDFRSSSKKTVSGLLLSNTCDISSENIRPSSANITFALIITCSSYENFLRVSGVASETVASHLQSVKRQQVSNRFYLPPPMGMRGSPDYVALLDEVHSMPLNIFS